MSDAPQPVATVTVTASAEPLKVVTDESERIVVAIPASWAWSGSASTSRDGSEVSMLAASEPGPDSDAPSESSAIAGIEVIAAPESWGTPSEALDSGAFYWGKACPSYDALATPEPEPEPAFELPEGAAYSLKCDQHRLQLWAGSSSDGATMVVTMRFTEGQWETDLPRRIWESIRVWP